MLAITISLITISTYSMEVLVIRPYDTESHNEEFPTSMRRLSNHEKKKTSYTPNNNISDPHNNKSDLQKNESIINHQLPTHTLSDDDLHTLLRKAVEDDDIILVKWYYESMSKRSIDTSNAFQINCFKAAGKKGNVTMIQTLFNHSAEDDKDLHANIIVRGAAEHGHRDVIKLFPIATYRFKLDWKLIMLVAEMHKQYDILKFILEYIRVKSHEEKNT
jgi:hypothetical protein